MMNARRIRNALVIGLMGVAWSLAVVPTSGAAEAGDLDPVVLQVVDMLTGGVEEEVIIQWLEATDRRPVDVGSKGLIALTEAGASKELMGRLLELVAETSRAPEPPPAPDAPARVPPPAAPQPSVPQVSDPAAKEAYPAARVDAPGDVLFLLSYQRAITQEPEPDSPPPEPWTVYAYLDGELVAWVTDSLAGEPVRASRQLAPGPHVLRVIQERHIRRGRRWVHESRVAPTFIAFEVVPGEEMEVDLRFHGRWKYRESRGPLSYAVRRGNQTLVEEGPTGGDPSEWRPVCEDVKANFPDADKVPRVYRRDMARCAPWSDLWQGAGEETSRTELLASMSESDFRPAFR